MKSTLRPRRLKERERGKGSAACSTDSESSAEELTLGRAGRDEHNVLLVRSALHQQILLLDLLRPLLGHALSESPRSLLGRPRRMLEFILAHDEGLDAEDLATEFLERDAHGRVESEDALEDAVGVVGDGEDRAKEVGVAEVGAEGLVGGAGLLPRVATAGEVDEDDAERPDVVVRGGVGGEALEETTLAFYETGEGKGQRKLGRSSEEENIPGLM